MPPVNIAVAGAGVIGRAHIAVIAQSSQCRLSAIADPSEAAQALAQTHGVPWFATLDELLATASPDGVILATPNAMHVPQALQCIAAGVPVLVEKPIAHTVADAQKLVQATQTHSAKVLIGHHRAHSPIMREAKAVIDEGRLGQLVSVMGSAMFYKPDDYFTQAPWRHEVGGGPVLINLIHEIHNLRMLCGEIIEVQAMTSNVVRGFAVEDTASITFRFASGVLASFMLSDTAASARSWEQTSQENKAYASYDDEDCYVIAGTMGSLAVPTMRLKTYVKAEDRSWFKPYQSSTVALEREDPLRLQMDHFIRVIQGVEEPLVSAHDGLQNLLVVEAIAQAAASQQTVRLA
ncbi:oxidoreductase [Limnohabitans sp. TS-CS-82]|uniref:Gfo/Idh/MocA family protein n=1 Tax=Limnohabitans sp. TS-CS-82 TaxID=2094193 RepID=UPI000CF24F7D|nr:Gfo/Idh/MocA family oxidoreductase [Limnohabitans sp. TS-CS-82]PQA84234.1 oxidoreductase [Limnohabitans sp. TS-CS-82]